MSERDSQREAQGTAERGAATRVLVAGQVPGDVRDVTFHTAVRGYERREVDRYVQRVNRTIAELEIARSPESAVRHALDRVGEQTSGILQRARETADEIIHTARSEAEETAERTRARADEQALERRALEEQRLEEIRARAEAEMDALRAGTDLLAKERRRGVEEIHELAARLEAVADSGTIAAPGAAAEDVGEPERAGAGREAGPTGREPTAATEREPTGVEM